MCILIKDIVHRFFKLQEENEAVSRSLLVFFILSSLTCFSSCSLNYLVCGASSPVCSVYMEKEEQKVEMGREGGERNTWSRGLLLSSSESL